MPRSLAQRVELIAGMLALAVCLGAIIWGFATNVRDSSPPSIMMEGYPEIILDDMIGVSGIRDLSGVKLRFLGLIVLAATGVAAGAALHVLLQRKWATAVIWLGAFVLLGCGIASVRTLGMPLFIAATFAFVSAIASSIATIPGEVTSTPKRIQSTQ